MTNHWLLYSTCVASGWTLQAIIPQLKKALVRNLPAWELEYAGWGLKASSRIKAFERLARLYGWQEARKDMAKLLPPHRKEHRFYTVAVMWLPWMLDLEMQFDSYAEAKTYAIQLKAEYPNNFFFVKWVKNSLKKAGNINWDLNDLRNRALYDDTFGSEVFITERSNQ